jgi:hypothetical protein
VNNLITLTGVNFDSSAMYAVGYLPPAAVNCEQVWSMGQGMEGDLNKDCHVDFKDVGVFSEDWLNCNDPAPGGCL